MDEQRILAEIEQNLARAEPVLAARLTSFAGPGSMGALRSTRVRIFASCMALVAVTLVSLIVYTLLPLRAMPDRGGGRATSAARQPTMTAPQRPALFKGQPQPPVSTLSR